MKRPRKKKLRKPTGRYGLTEVFKTTKAAAKLLEEIHKEIGPPKVTVDEL